MTKGSERNNPCPCGSGVKAKRCAARVFCERFIPPPPTEEEILRARVEVIRARERLAEVYLIATAAR